MIWASTSFPLPLAHQVAVLDNANNELVNFEAEADELLPVDAAPGVLVGLPSAEEAIAHESNDEGAVDVLQAVERVFAEKAVQAAEDVANMLEEIEVALVLEAPASPGEQAANIPGPTFVTPAKRRRANTNVSPASTLAASVESSPVLAAPALRRSPRHKKAVESAEVDAAGPGPSTTANKNKRTRSAYQKKLAKYHSEDDEDDEDDVDGEDDEHQPPVAKKARKMFR